MSKKIKYKIIMMSKIDIMYRIMLKSVEQRNLLELLYVTSLSQPNSYPLIGILKKSIYYLTIQTP